MKPMRYTQEMMDRFIREGYWGHPTIADLWDRNARLYPEREALVDSRGRITWSEGKVLTDRLALGFLELGFKKDDVVALQLPNSLEHVLLRVALLKAGLLALPILMFFRQRELLYVLDRVDAVGFVTCCQYRGVDQSAMVAEMRPQLPALQHHFVVDDTLPPGAISLRGMLETPLEQNYPPDYLQQFRFPVGEVTHLGMTSGTTGLPKIVQMMEDQWGMISTVSVKRWQLAGDDVMLALAPIAGGPSGGSCYNAAPLVGAKAVLMEHFDPEEALALIEREGVTFATGVPAQMVMMVRHPNLSRYDLSSLRTFYYAGSVCPEAVAQEVEEKMGCRILTRFGMFDVGSLATTCYDDPVAVRWHAVGKPIDGMEIRLIDDDGAEVPAGQAGEVIVRGAICVPGFHRDEERTLEAWGGPEGWYHTGDLGRFDEEGNLYLVGRKKDIIIRGGQNIYPIEVESLLLQHPKVANVAVVSMPDPVMGEKACACVILKSGETLTFAEMVGFLRERQIAPYKLPERLEMVQSFPLGSDGQKVLKNLLTEEVTRRMRTEGREWRVEG